MKINLGKVFDTGSGGREPIVEALSVTENGTYTPSTGVDGFNPVEVNVQPPLQTKSVEITANGQSTIEADSGFYGLESVGLNVNVQPNLQAKSTSTTITENGTSTITLQPDSNYDGLSSASVTITTNVASSGGSAPKIYIKDGTKLKLADNNGEVSDLSNILPLGLTSMSGMFSGSKTTGIKNIGGWDTSKVTDMNNIFGSCSNLTSLVIGKWDTSKVTDMSQMFMYCDKLSDLKFDFRTSNVTTMNHMFYNCQSLTSLDLSGFDTSNVTTMEGMFNQCSKLTSINLNGFNTSKVTTMREMFNQCSKLTSLDLSGWNVSSVTNMYLMFNFCSNLTSLNLSNLNMNKVTSVYWMIRYCDKLTDLNMNGAILPKIDLSNLALDTCKALTVDSLVSVLNALQQLSEGESYTCTIGSDNLAKLSDEQKAIATNKGWTIN